MGVLWWVRVCFSPFLPHIPSVALDSSDGSNPPVVLEGRVTRMGSTESMSAKETTGRGKRRVTLACSLVVEPLLYTQNNPGSVPGSNSRKDTEGPFSANMHSSCQSTDNRESRVRFSRRQPLMI